MFENSVRDPRTRRYISPTRIVWKSESGIDSPELLLQRGIGQSVVFGNYQGAILKRGASLLLDFGTELHGGAQLVTGQRGQNRTHAIRLRFGESVSEAMHEPNNDHAMHDMTVSLPWAGLSEYGQTGFRFLRIDLLDEDAEVELLEVRAVCLLRDVPYRGAFCCNDERLNEIWRVGAHTVHLNMQEYLWDGIKRDRLVWIGDLYPEQRVILAVFGANEVVPKSLDLLRERTPLPGWMNSISSYSLWWILSHRDWYLFQNDRAYLQAQKPYLEALTNELLAHLDAAGLAPLPHFFLDHPSSHDTTAIAAASQALLSLSFSALTWLYGELNAPDMQERCQRALETLQSHAPAMNANKSAAALVALAGLETPEQMNQSILANAPTENIASYYGYLLLKARAAAQDWQGCLELIRAYWGGMLDLGATTFWEDFDLSWIKNAGRIDALPQEGDIDVHMTYGDYCYKGLRHSLCHGWAAGPTAWLSEHVLGVRPLSPGFEQTLVQPQLGDLTWAEGTYPTPHGDIHVHHERNPDGNIHSRIDAPPATQIVRHLPATGTSSGAQIL